MASFSFAVTAIIKGNARCRKQRELTFPEKRRTARKRGREGSFPPARAPYYSRSPALRRRNRPAAQSKPAAARMISSTVMVLR